MKKLDDAEMYLLNFERPDTPRSASTTHIGIFLAWALLKGLGSPSHVNYDFSRLEARQITGSTLLTRYCGSTLVDRTDLNQMGSAFAASYYDQYFHDYLTVFGLSTTAPLDVLAQVADDWASYDKVAAVLDRRFTHWFIAQGFGHAAMPKRPTYSPSATVSVDATYAAGARVNHSRFGQGTVLTCNFEHGTERVLVSFDTSGEKWLAVGIAPLARLGDA